MGRFLYFAYGSNMLPERLRAPARCPSAEFIGAAIAEGLGVTFNKKSRDGSGKAEMRKAHAGGVVHGALYSIDQVDAATLDQVEGHGYERIDDVAITRSQDGAALLATTYLGRPSVIERGLKPYDWYLAFAIAGAMRCGLPGDYVGSLRNIESIADPNEKRRAAAVEILASAQFPSLKSVLGAP